MTSAATTWTGGRGALTLGTVASVVLHAAFFAFLVRLPSASLTHETVAVDVVEAAPPPPPAPVAEPARPAPEPVAVARPRPRPVPRDAPPPPAPLPDDAPPPPNQTPPADAPKRAPVRIGVSMSSTTTAGGVAAPVGNTLYGELPKTAPDPRDVKPYAADRYAPPTQVSTLPKGGCEIPEAEYPPDALERGQAGAVALQLLVGTDGKVREVKVVRDPLGFGSAATQSALRHCRFTPAKRGDEVVATWIPYTIRYEPR